MRFFKLLLMAAFTIGFLVFAVALIGQNQEELSVQFFHYVSPSYPKWVVLLGSFFAGAICATVFFIAEIVILESRAIRLKRLNQKLERALAAATGTVAPGTVVSTNGAGATISPSASRGSPAMASAAVLDDSDV